MSNIVYGLPPFFDSDSKVLILGSFPSVKSRQVEFYYGNNQNRFWRVLTSFFNEELPLTVPDKKSFLAKHNIALWDVVVSCEIKGSSDSSIKNVTVADINMLLSRTNVKTIIINGGTAAKLFNKYFNNATIPVIALPSTSPANVRFNREEWDNALRTAFERA
jgi:hypoxanthine-DNA glycosylase